MSKLLGDNTVTRQEVIDYVVNKKVRAIKDEMAPIENELEGIRENRAKANKAWLMEKSKYSLEWIKENYNEVIEKIQKTIKNL